MSDENKNPTTDTGNEIDLTDEELALASQGDGDPAAAGATGATGAADQETPEGKDDDGDDQGNDIRTLAVAATKAAEAASAAAAELAASRQPPQKEDPASAAQAEPDWDAKKSELKAKYDAGEIDDDEYEKQREDLIEQKADYKATKRIDEVLTSRLAKQAETAAEQDWNQALAAFGADENNKKFVGDPVRAAAFNATLQAVWKENPNQGYLAAMQTARDRVMTAFGLKPADDPKAKIDAAVAERAGKKPGTPPNISALPSAGVPAGGDNNFATLDSLSIDELENTLSRMPANKVEEYLATAKGGLRDNPRLA